MSKKIVCIMLSLVILLTPCMSVSAEERTGYCKDGRLYANWTYYYSSKLEFLDSFQMDVALDNEYVEDGYIYLVEKTRENGYIEYYLCGSGKATVSIANERSCESDSSYEYTNVKSPEQVSLRSYTDSANLTVMWSYDGSSEKNYQNMLKDITIPIFSAENEEGFKSYEETGDTSGAENNDHYVDNYDESIPIPHNVKILQGTDQSISGSDLEYLTVFNHDIVLSWTQEDVLDNMKFEIQGEFSAKRISDNDYTSMQEYTGYNRTLIAKTDYGGTTSMTVQIPKSTLNSCKEKGYLTTLKIKIRNMVGNKTSNWVTVTIDLKNKTATATETGYEDSSQTGGDEYNDTNVDYDSNNENNANGDFSIDGIMSYIKSGFGLLGNNGIIALMSRTYLYLPASVWTIIKFFISMLVAICVIKLVKEVLL